MKKNKPYKTVIGKGFGEDSSFDPKFRLFSGTTNPNNLTVAEYHIVTRDDMPRLEIIKMHSVLDILNEVIDSYAKRVQNENK